MCSSNGIDENYIFNGSFQRCLTRDRLLNRTAFRFLTLLSLLLLQNQVETFMRSYHCLVAEILLMMYIREEHVFLDL